MTTVLRVTLTGVMVYFSVIIKIRCREAGAAERERLDRMR